eukprot:354315-Chlamydomonas_euryale.AAC.1
MPPLPRTASLARLARASIPLHGECQDATLAHHHPAHNKPVPTLIVWTSTRVSTPGAGRAAWGRARACAEGGPCLRLQCGQRKGGKRGAVKGRRGCRRLMLAGGCMGLDASREVLAICCSTAEEWGEGELGLLIKVPLGPSSGLGCDRTGSWLATGCHPPPGWRPGEGRPSASLPARGGRERPPHPPLRTPILLPSCKARAMHARTWVLGDHAAAARTRDFDMARHRKLHVDHLLKDSGDLVDLLRYRGKLRAGRGWAQKRERGEAGHKSESGVRLGTKTRAARGWAQKREWREARTTAGAARGWAQQAKAA